VLVTRSQPAPNATTSPDADVQENDTPNAPQVRHGRNDATDLGATDLGPVDLGVTGHVALNFYNLFWIFMLCSTLGLVIETAYHLVLFGSLESRAGLVWGPFSPIYGSGACLYTICLNRFHDKNIIVIFLVAMVVGMTLEFCTSFMMQYGFGVIAWDYTGTFGNIDGRTNIAFGMMWGFLGVVWVRVLLQLVLRMMRHIPFKAHITFTALVSLFMVANICVTLFAFERYYQRAANMPETSVISQLCDEYFPDSFMQDRFQNLSTLPDNA
jgi:uncharacterized membrane protein